MPCVFLGLSGPSPSPPACKDGGLEGLEGAGDTETEEAEPSSDGEVQDEKESSEDEPEEAQQDKQDQDESGAETEDEVGSENDSKQNQAGDGSVQKVVEETESAGEYLGIVEEVFNGVFERLRASG